MAVSWALLRAVADGVSEPVVRVYRPAPCVAFGRTDAMRPGFERATEAARAHGFTPIARLAGGHAVAYDQDCLIVEVIRRAARISGALEHRFHEVASLLRNAAATEGIALELGEREGEPCPGRFSLHLPAGPKVAGIAQRVVAGAALTSSVLVVGGGDEQRAVITDVYAELGLPVRADLAGAVTDHYPDATVTTLESSVMRYTRAHLDCELRPLRHADSRSGTD